MRGFREFRLPRYDRHPLTQNTSVACTLSNNIKNEHQLFEQKTETNSSLYEYYDSSVFVNASWKSSGVRVTNGGGQRAQLPPPPGAVGEGRKTASSKYSLTNTHKNEYHKVCWISHKYAGADLGRVTRVTSHPPLARQPISRYYYACDLSYFDVVLCPSSSQILATPLHARSGSQSHPL